MLAVLIQIQQKQVPFSRKPKKKKIPTILVIAAGVLVVAAIVVVLILPGKSGNSYETGTLLVTNRTPGTIWVGIDNSIGGSIESLTDETYSLSVGTHDVTISNNEDTRTVSLDIIGGHQISVYVYSSFWDID